jgi:hypothetical protein
MYTQVVGRHKQVDDKGWHATCLPDVRAFIVDIGIVTLQIPSRQLLESTRTAHVAKEFERVVRERGAAPFPLWGISAGTR